MTDVACRAVRSQRFVRDTEADVRAREQRSAAALAALEPVRKHLTAAEADAFYGRLVEDSERRVLNRFSTYLKLKRCLMSDLIKIIITRLSC